MKQILEKIKNINIKKVKEEELEILLPDLGMNNENLSEMPIELSSYFGKGLKFWQYPNQLNLYLKQLSKYKINSYLEIGCRWGGTFIITTEFLKKTNQNVKGYACDINPISDILTEYKNYSDFNYLHMSSFDLNRNIINNDIDLILIDGDHSYEGLKRDFETSKQFNPKYISFHDISSDVCPGVVKFWNEIKENYTHYEYTNQYDSVNGSFLGIGLIEL